MESKDELRRLVMRLALLAQDGEIFPGFGRLQQLLPRAGIGRSPRHFPAFFGFLFELNEFVHDMPPYA